MLKFIIKRALGLIPLLILVSMFSFMIIQAAPGDPLDNYMQPGMTEEDAAALRAEYGLDGNLFEQYWHWLKNVLQGEFGTSIHKTRPVADLIAERLPATLKLMGTSLLISICCSIPLGLIAGLNKTNASIRSSVPSFTRAFPFFLSGSQ